MNVSKMIKGHELFRAFGFEEVERISAFSGAKSYQAGEYVFQRGDSGTHFFVVLDGRVDIVLPSEDGESNLVVGRMEKGDIFGVAPLLGFERYTAAARCSMESSVLAVEVAPFRELLKENPAVGFKAMNVMAQAYFTRYIETLKRFQSILNDLVLQ